MKISIMDLILVYDKEEQQNLNWQIQSTYGYINFYCHFNSFTISQKK